MKINCTKREWAMIEASLDANLARSTLYNFPYFECVVYDPVTLEFVLFFDGVFVEQEGTKCKNGRLDFERKVEQLSKAQDELLQNQTPRQSVSCDE